MPIFFVITFISNALVAWGLYYVLSDKRYTVGKARKLGWFFFTLNVICALVGLILFLVSLLGV